MAEMRRPRDFWKAAFGAQRKLNRSKIAEYDSVLLLDVHVLRTFRLFLVSPHTILGLFTELILRQPRTIHRNYPRTELCKPRPFACCEHHRSRHHRHRLRTLWQYRCQGSVSESAQALLPRS
jgi:hypothetical protein